MAAHPPPTLSQLWLTETVHEAEQRWGPAHDSALLPLLDTTPDAPEPVVQRAERIARAQGLLARSQQIAAALRLGVIGWLVLALLAGMGAASAALGDGSRPVNLFPALVGLLGLNLLAWLFWLVSLALPGGLGSLPAALLGRLSAWLARRPAATPAPDANTPPLLTAAWQQPTRLLPGALMRVLGQWRLLTPLTGLLSHAVWTVLLGSATVTLLLLLSTRRYVFQWETTLLSPDTFVQLTQALGALPARLGFAQPSAEAIRLSDGLQAVPVEISVLWSSWLIGCLVVYGVLPRLLAAIGCALLARQRWQRARLNVSWPQSAALRDRLARLRDRLGVVDPEPARQAVAAASGPDLTQVDASVGLVAGLELDPDEAWPPWPLSPDLHDAGRIDDRASRHTLAARVAQARTPLLLVCDARRVPDRGIVRYIGTLAQQVPVQVWLRSASQAPAERQGQWRELLASEGIAPTQVSDDIGRLWPALSSPELAP